MIHTENKQYSVLEIANCLKPIFEKNKIKKAILFGSYAKGQSNSTSDIDIVVDSRMKGLKFVGLIEEIRESLGTEIDLLDVSRIEADSKVADEIQRIGKLIYEKWRQVRMNKIVRNEIDEMWAHSAIVEAGNHVYISYCMKNEGESIENQISGAFDVLSQRLETIGLTLQSVVQMDCLFKNINDLNYLEKIIKEKFDGKYPARKAFETKFIREGIEFQVDAIAFKEK